MQPTEDERVLAALSHASIVANVVNLAGMIATALIWTMQRDRSPYVRAHSLQALVYQGAVLLISIFLALFWVLCLVLSLLPVILRPDLYRTSPPGYSVWIGVFGAITLVGFWVAATVYGLYGAYQVYRGRPFHYPLVGRLARFAPAATPAASTAAPPAAPEQTTEVTPIVPVTEAAPPQPAAAITEPPKDSPSSGATPPTPKRRGRRSPPEDEG
jgi:uncharacterized Tic20 family protein